LNGLFDNYFVRLRPPEQPELLCCSICYEETILKTCSHCAEKHCPNCRESHKLALKLAGEDYEHSSDSDENATGDLDLDDRDLTDEANVPFNLILGQTIRTQFNAKLLSTFKVTSMMNTAEEGRNPPIYSIFLLAEDRYMVILNTGPETVEYNPDGSETNRWTFPCGITDITETPDKRVLFVHPGDCFILEIDIRDTRRISIFAPCKECRPICLTSFKDGRLVVAGFVVRKESREREEEEEEDRKGTMLIYDKYGKLIKEVSGGTNGPILRCPMCVSINHFNNSICVADQDLNCVTIFSETGELLTRYDGGQSTSRFGLFWNHAEFVPQSLCHDSDGNIIVANTVDGLLHVLQPDGKFLGYVLTRDTEQFGRPSGIMMDVKNRVWIGDRVDGKIRIYEISSYKNSFNQQESLNPFAGRFVA
jgi:sugar lactone lactonase YvrE